MATAFPECPGAARASSVYNRRKEKPLAAFLAPPSPTADDAGSDRRAGGEDPSDSGFSDSDEDSRDGGDLDAPSGCQSARDLGPERPSSASGPPKPRRPSTTPAALQASRMRRHSTHGSPAQTALLDGVRRQLGRRHQSFTLAGGEAPQPAAPSRQSRLSVGRREPQAGEAGGAVGSDARPQDDRRPRAEPSGSGNAEITASERASRMTTPGSPTIAETPKSREGHGSGKVPEISQRPKILSREDQSIASKSNANAPAWTAAFRKLQNEGGEIDRKVLPRALDIAGVLRPNAEWIAEIAGTVSACPALEPEEFFQLLRLYTAREIKERKEVFEKMCERGDKSGTLDQEEVISLLDSMGIDVMFHVLSEAFREVDARDRGRINVDAFDKLMDSLAARQCFTSTEHEDFHRIYQRHDRDSSGSVNKEDLVSILGWLGYAGEQERAEDAAQEVSGTTMTEREFIFCMRKVHEFEIQLIRDTVIAKDEQKDDRVPAQKLGDVLRLLGYLDPDSKAIKEVAEDLQIADENERLDLGDIWQFLIIYRKREGLSNAEDAELKEAFQRYDKAQKGEITGFEVSKLLRWLGYQLPHEVLQHFMNRVDVDESDSLDFGELRKLIRMHRERDLALMVEAFELQEPDFKGTIGKTKVLLALGHLGYMDNKASKDAEGLACEVEDKLELIPESEVKADRVDLKSFFGIASRASKASRRAFRKNGGFTSSQVTLLKEIFKRYDLNGSGSLCNKEIIILIEDVLPEMAHDTHMRPELIKLMKEADADGNGCLEFPDFLRLMRQFHEVQDRKRINKEQSAIKETGFSQTEVAGFRELFIVAAGDDCCGELSFEGVCNLIDGVTPLGDKYLNQLYKMFDEVVRSHKTKARPLTGPKSVLISLLKKDQVGTGEKAPGDKPEDKTMDFPEFLFLMKRLMDSDFAGIKARTKSK